MKLFRLIWIFAAFTCFAVRAQDSVQPAGETLYDHETNVQTLKFDREIIQEFKKQEAFAYVELNKADSWWIRFKQWLQLKYQQALNWLFGDYEANELLRFFLLILPYLILIAVIAFAFWLFTKLNPGHIPMQTPETPGVLLEEEEKILRSKDIDKLIEIAVRERDYRLALRYYYLQLLQQLHQQQLISYDFQKTNSDYLNEIDQLNLRQALKHVMRLYDFTWYGGFPLSEENFDQAQKDFENLQHTLKSNFYE